jgi:hypothetical protein
MRDKELKREDVECRSLSHSRWSFIVCFIYFLQQTHTVLHGIYTVVSRQKK